MLSFSSPDDTLIIDGATQITGGGTLFVAGTLQITSADVLANIHVNIVVKENANIYVPDLYLGKSTGKLYLFGNLHPTVPGHTMSIPE